MLGSPIGHSRSPELHSAAYRVLGLPWSYERVEMTGDALPQFLAGLGDEWRGLSLTMPLKRDVLPLLDERDELVTLTGVCNTVRLDAGRRLGYNTDVYGIVSAFIEAGVTSLRHVQVLGGGATAASAVVAAARLGAHRVAVSVRDPGRSRALVDLGPPLGIRIDIDRLGAPLADQPDAVISTLPNGVDAGLAFVDATKRGSVLFDVAYDPWPTSLAAEWLNAGGRVISGLGMLLHQAVMQVRIFTSGDPDRPLADEAGVLAAMRAGIGLAST